MVTPAGAAMIESMYSLRENGTHYGGHECRLRLSTFQGSNPTTLERGARERDIRHNLTLLKLTCSLTISRPDTRRGIA